MATPSPSADPVVRVHLPHERQQARYDAGSKEVTTAVRVAASARAGYAECGPMTSAVAGVCSGRDSFSSTKITRVGVSPMFSP